MEYRGKFEVFNFNRIKTYSIKERVNKTRLENLLNPEQLKQSTLQFYSQELEEVAARMIDCHKQRKPVIWFNGAHLIKNGMSPIVIDLIKRRIITLYATNGAGSIHDFELALIGETSEHVPNALPQGKFGMAYETGKYMNDALIRGNELKLGYGESLARMILGEKFPYRVHFPYPHLSIIATAYKMGIPATVHVSIGTDIINQHPNFDGEALGGTSARDFAIYAAQIEKLTQGGVILNIGSAVTGPEVLLKAVSMAANVGHVPDHIVTANFDLRPIVAEDIQDEKKATYYFRDNKSVVTRIPEAFNGKGYYIMGDQLETIPALYQMLVWELEKEAQPI
ncbi:MAG: hypothetical protein ONB05_02045 [candidate division KSB1 bacterium]|nr:hypothetical protein [candidate division KSB1 bacterium]